MYISLTLSKLSSQDGEIRHPAQNISEFSCTEVSLQKIAALLSHTVVIICYQVACAKYSVLGMFFHQNMLM